MKLIDLADQTFRDLGQPNTLSLPQIADWYRYNIGQLNLQIHTEIIYDSTLDEFVEPLTIEQANIYKLMYFIKFADTNRIANLGASSYDWSELDEGDTTIRKVSKNEIAKSYKLMRDGYATDMAHLVYLYKNNQIVPQSWVYEGRQWLNFVRLTCRNCI